LFREYAQEKTTIMKASRAIHSPTMNSLEHLDASKEDALFIKETS